MELISTHSLNCGFAMNFCVVHLVKAHLISSNAMCLITSKMFVKSMKV